MKKSALVSLFVAAPLLAAPLTWETLIQSADQDVRYQASQKRANIATSRNTKLWEKLELRYKLDGFSFADKERTLFIENVSDGGLVVIKDALGSKEVTQKRASICASLAVPVLGDSESLFGVSFDRNDSCRRLECICVGFIKDKTKGLGKNL